MKPRTFGFDVDGTITAAPKAFASIMGALRDAGHYVYVITGQTRDVTPADYTRRRNQLDSLGVHQDVQYDALHIAGPPDWVEDKRLFCEQHLLDFVFEDSLRYAEAISTICPVTVMYETP